MLVNKLVLRVILIVTYANVAKVFVSSVLRLPDLKLRLFFFLILCARTGW